MFSITQCPPCVAAKNCAIVPGKEIIEDAKITGITPAGFIFNGKNVCLSLTKFKPCPVC